MLGLIRPYLNKTACHYSRDVSIEESVIQVQLESIQHEWMTDALLKEASNRLFLSWQNDVKIYLKNQRSWNGLEDDFDWTIGDLTFDERVDAILQTFGVIVSTKEIVSADSFMSRTEEVVKFWNILNSFEKFRLDSLIKTI